MKINNRGFAITAVLYGLLILFVILVSSYLTILSVRKNRVDNLIDDIESKYREELNSNNEDPGQNNEEDPSSIGTLYEVVLTGFGVNTLNSSIYYSPDDRLWYSDEEKEDAITRITPPTLSQYSFSGFYTEDNGRGTQIIDSTGKIISNAISADTVLYAYWVRNNGGDASA